MFIHFSSDKKNGLLQRCIKKVFLNKKVPLNIFRNNFFSSAKSNKYDTILFGQKPCLKTNYIDIKKEYIDMKLLLRIKKLPDLLGIREPASMFYADTKFNVPRRIKDPHTLTSMLKNRPTFVMLKEVDYELSVSN